MALTVEQLGRTNVTGNRHTVALKLTPTGNWPTAGEPLDLTAYVANIESVHVESDIGGYVYNYDRSAKKLLAYESGANGTALDAVDGATSLSAQTVYVTVTGGRA